jgi:hypothetical protein
MSLMMTFAAVAMEAAPDQPPKFHSLRWEGTGEVYPPGGTIKLAIRTRIEGDRVISESWPIEQGQAKGMHRMTLDADAGTVEIGGKTDAMPRPMWDEEHAQYGIYLQLQEAAERAPKLARLGVKSLSVAGAVTTWFRIDGNGTIVGASNQVPAGEIRTRAHQTFRFDGFWHSNGFVFPRHMEMMREGKPYFTLDVTRFDAD